MIPVGWLKEHVEVSLPAEELAHRLTMAGLEVEEVRETDGERVLDITITPNRGDALSVVGVAREVAALTEVSWRPAPEGVTAEGPAERTWCAPPEPLRAGSPGTVPCPSSWSSP